MGAAAATARASFGAVIPRLSLDRDLEQSTSIENGGRGSSLNQFCSVQLRRASL